jgi:hypothetical protein
MQLTSHIPDIEIFSDMADVMVIYIDDLMIYTKTDDIHKHERLVKKVLQ